MQPTKEQQFCLYFLIHIAPLIFICEYSYFLQLLFPFIYSQVHKYWDINAILIFLALYTTTMDLKLNKQDVL